MPSKDPLQRFLDILDNIHRIERFTAGLDLASFSATEETLYAVNHALLIISEAAPKLGETAPLLCPGIPRNEIRGLGNRLRHDYDNINFERIWLTVQKDVPLLKTAVQRTIKTLEEPQRP